MHQYESILCSSTISVGWQGTHTLLYLQAWLSSRIAKMACCKSWRCRGSPAFKLLKTWWWNSLGNPNSYWVIPKMEIPQFMYMTGAKRREWGNDPQWLLIIILATPLSTKHQWVQNERPLNITDFSLFLVFPSGKVCELENHLYIWMAKSTMAMFSSYVKLPVGDIYESEPFLGST